MCCDTLTKDTIKFVFFIFPQMLNLFQVRGLSKHSSFLSIYNCILKMIRKMYKGHKINDVELEPQKQIFKWPNVTQFSKGR